LSSSSRNPRKKRNNEEIAQVVVGIEAVGTEVVEDQSRSPQTVIPRLAR
jgi:hypothetical protein